MQDLAKLFEETRNHTLSICEGLEPEDFVVQPQKEVSPPKWHLGHTTWFFDTFVLGEKYNYKSKSWYSHVFNSYYKGAGSHWRQSCRGSLSRPGVEEILHYRKEVDERVLELLQNTNESIRYKVRVGIEHEKQHQELLFMDIKSILFESLSPIKNSNYPSLKKQNLNPDTEEFAEGLYEFGAGEENDFYYDNEGPKNKQWIPDFKISTKLVTEKEYLEFIEGGGYDSPEFWLSDGWDWICENHIKAPLYWREQEKKWSVYDWTGVRSVCAETPVAHLSYYEASAFAFWKGQRLPNEFELELYLRGKNQGELWNWSCSAYAPYPGYQAYKGLLAEYNGKFMINQQVLRGGSCYTPKGHYRATYRNFYRPHNRWQFSGLRLVEKERASKA